MFYFLITLIRKAFLWRRRRQINKIELYIETKKSLSILIIHILSLSLYDQRIAGRTMPKQDLSQNLETDWQLLCKIVAGQQRQDIMKDLKLDRRTMSRKLQSLKDSGIEINYHRSSGIYTTNWEAGEFVVKLDEKDLFTQLRLAQQAKESQLVRKVDKKLKRSLKYSSHLFYDLGRDEFHDMDSKKELKKILQLVMSWFR